jgi:hypothetical protein
MFDSGATGSATPHDHTGIHLAQLLAGMLPDGQHASYRPPGGPGWGRACQGNVWLVIPWRAMPG